MKLTREEIIGKTKRGKGGFEFELWAPLFAKDVRVTVFAQTNNLAEEITPYVTDCINAIMDMTETALSRIKKEIFKHYKVSIENTSYMMVPNSLLDKHDGNEELANAEFFGFESEEDAFQGAGIKEIHIVDYKQLSAQPLEFTIHFAVPWDDEHGISFLMNENGVQSVQ